MKLFLGWLAVTLTTLIAGFWGFWGSIEAFHEGWHRPNLAGRLFAVVAYTAPAMTFVILGLIALRWPRVGAGLFIAGGVILGTIILTSRSNIAPFIVTLLTLAPIIIGLLYLFGGARPLGLAYAVTAGIPIAVMIASGAGPAYRVATRVDDGDRGLRRVEGNGVTLEWAPAGPGWERDGGASWEQARDRCARLDAEGTSLLDEPQGIWRLPTVEEAVRSMVRNGKNAGGTWSEDRRAPRYAIRPDKETPLWDPYRPVIYWWTDTAVDEAHAYMIVYHGGVYAKPKTMRTGSLGFRAVRDVPGEGGASDE